MILTVGNIKGGVGKTTLAVNIAVALAQRGRDVLLIDGDEQASAATFAQLRAEQLDAAKLTTIQLQAKAIRQEMPALAAKYPEIVIDVGGRDSGSLRAAMTVADAILVPFQPRSMDLWTGDKILELISEARIINARLRPYAVLNVADAQGRDNDEALEALRSIEGIEVLPGVVVRRKAFANAVSAGLSVLEQMPRDAKACSEILSVVTTLYPQEAHNGY